MADIGKTRASLRIFGADLLPEEITSLLGCPPSKSAKAGDIDPRHKSETRIVKEGFWLLASDEDDNPLLEKKVETLLGKLTGDLSVWKQLTSKYKVDIFCGLFLNEFNEGFGVSPALLKKLGERNLEIGFDIYSGCE
jgi:hypothetical protein